MSIQVRLYNEELNIYIFQPIPLYNQFNTCFMRLLKTFLPASFFFICLLYLCFVSTRWYIFGGKCTKEKKRWNEDNKKLSGKMNGILGMKRTTFPLFSSSFIIHFLRIFPYKYAIIRHKWYKVASPRRNMCIVYGKMRLTDGWMIHLWFAICIRRCWQSFLP